MKSNTPHPSPQLVLGSTSRYRRELLHRFGLPFEVASPQVDETPEAGEAPARLACRLALAKARAVAEFFKASDAVVIGSDQVADLNGQPIGKPGHHAAAVAQLQAMRGKTVTFQTAVAVVRPQTGFEAMELIGVQVRFRSLADGLTDDLIETYLRTEQPYDCAGSAKSEGLGITLLEAIESNDPTALIGLPLIATAAMLRRAGLDPLQALSSPA